MEYIKNIKEFIKKIGNNGCLLGIDYGTKRIGMSVSDAERRFVFPLKTFKNSGIEGSASTIVSIIQEKKILGIVIGYPLQLNGVEGAQCEEVNNFATILSKKSNMPIFFQDERFSTKGAHAVLRELSMSRKQREKKDDAVAACNILQTTLNLLQNI